MKYLCFVYFEPHVMEGLSREELKALDRDSLAYDEALRKQGHFLAAEALQPVHAATTVRKRDGKVTMTDGPFAETKEVLGGFIYIEAADLDEALRIAGEIPMARLGSIEVRPVMTLSPDR